MTNGIPNAGRLSAHLLMDAASAYEHDAPEDLNTSSMNLALDRINQIDGVSPAATGGPATSPLCVRTVAKGC